MSGGRRAQSGARAQRAARPNEVSATNWPRGESLIEKIPGIDVLSGRSRAEGEPPRPSPADRPVKGNTASERGRLKNYKPTTERDNIHY